jgi:DHA1 family tetracycline resistance protein-like MFS transporter
MTELRQPRRAAFAFIFVCAVANVLSFGLIIPILPNLIKGFLGGDTAQAAEWTVVFATTWGLIQFAIGPVLGLLSDRYGRRPVLLISLFGLGIDFIIMGLAPNLAWLFVGRLISGATSATFPTCYAYVADVTPPERRARAFGWMGSAMSVGFLAGPAIGGLLGDIDLRLPFFAAAALSLLNVVYGVFVLPESLPPERRATRFEWKKANPVGSLTLLRSHRDLIGMATIGFLAQLAQIVWPAVFVLYTGYRYGWGPAAVGWAMMFGGVLGVLVQSFVVGPVVGRIGEKGALLAGVLTSAFGAIWTGFSAQAWMYLACLPIASLGGLLIPGLQGLMTRRVAPHEQGQLQGANQCLNGLASLIGPMVYGLSFAWWVRHGDALGLPAAPMELSGGFLVIAFLLALGIGRRARTQTAAVDASASAG